MNLAAINFSSEATQARFEQLRDRRAKISTTGTVVMRELYQQATPSGVWKEDSNNFATAEQKSQRPEPW